MSRALKTRVPPRTFSASRQFSTISADVLAFVIGLTTSIIVRVVGDLPVAEVIVVAFLPILSAFHWRRVVTPPNSRIVFSLLALWLFGQVISDVYHETATLDWVRGDAAIIFFGIDLLALGMLLLGNERRKVIFIVGTVVGSLVMVAVAPSELALEAPWKFGYANGIITLVLLVSCYFYARRRNIISGLLVAGIAAVNLRENFRSQVLELLVALVLVFPVIPERIGRLRILPRSGSLVRITILAGFALGAGWLAGSLVNYTTNAGLISEEDQAKNQEQKRGGSFLLAGRPEILVSARAVMESPVIGHGSWAKDLKYIEMLHDIQIERGMGMNSSLDFAEVRMGGLIPAHSHIMGSWIWAGILGATFWMYIFWLALQAALRVTSLRLPLAPLYAYAIIGLIWNVFFSPFGQTARIGDAVAILIVIDLLGTKPVIDMRSYRRIGGSLTARRFVRPTNVMPVSRPFEAPEM